MKDKDLMRDTGGRHRTKDLQRPERPDRKKRRRDDGDRDFDDVSKDPDLRTGSRRRAAVELRRLAMELMDGNAGWNE